MNIQTLFSLSKQGKRDLYKTTLFTSIHQLSVILPVILLIMLTDEMISHIKIGEPHTINLWKYIILSLTLLTLIYIIYLKTYQQMYVNSGKETAIMRIRLAEKFRKLPLSYLSSRDLSDFTSTLMDDVSVIEKQLTSDFANLIAGIVSSMVTLIVLSFYNWQMSAILFLIMPIALLFIAISKFATAATNKKNRQLKLNISEALQEYLENIKVIKSTNQKRNIFNN
ncbi:ABC transporter transmembrane domain-containing protein [Staphylococcus lugdunensis]|uniref:ABC transporter transmembrane domain-containing protein n=1 Tax=Staphylococcus lugdunensis TaxID=28035 RepID=UPI001EFF02C3|nr:ABC transporter transmembrane domain-containing protein [Staphylococcus lugdunensis]